MNNTIISCILVALMALPAAAAKVVTPHVLVLTADVAADTLPGVIAWAAVAPPFSSLAVPLLDNGGTGPYGQRVSLQTTAGFGGNSFKIADAKALSGCMTTMPAAGYHCAIIARVSAK